MNFAIRMLARRIFALLVFAVALFVVLASFAAPGRAEQLVASWYGVGDGFAGEKTANGEVFDPYAYTAAHKTLPFDTKLEVTYGGKSVVVRINDRGPYVQGRDIDLSYIAAEEIGLTVVGSAPVEVEYVESDTPVGPVQTASTVPAQKSAPEPSPEPVPAQDPAQDPAQVSAQEAEPRESAEIAPEERAGKTERPVADQATEVTEVTDEQYVDEEQYGVVQDAAEDQYDVPVSEASAPEPTGDAPGPAEFAPEQSQQAEPGKASPATVASPPGELEEPPAALVKPGSTVEHRIELNVAAKPGTATDSPDTPELAPVPEDLLVSGEKPEGAGTTSASGPTPETQKAPDTEAPDTEAPDTEAPDAEAPDAEAPDAEQHPEVEAGTQEIKIERLPDTGGPVTLPRVSVMDLVAFLLVSVVLHIGLRRLKA